MVHIHFLKIFSLIFATVKGTGIGAALAQKGVIHRGSRGLIEGGHMIVDPSLDAQRCGCGQQGCLEVLNFSPTLPLLSIKSREYNFIILL
jgi:glucokinase